jgi:hypothetical protein
MERDFGKDFSIQAREEWRAVRLEQRGRHLTAKEWRDFQLKFEVAAERVEDKGDREEYELLYAELPSRWQEKVLKEEATRSDGQNWVRVTGSGSTVLSQEDIQDFLVDQGIRYSSIKEKGVGFLVKLRNSEETQKTLRLDGSTSGRTALKITRTDIPLTARAIFDLVAKDLRIKDEANFRRQNTTEATRRIQRTEVEGSSSEEETQEEKSRIRDKSSEKGPKVRYPSREKHPSHVSTTQGEQETGYTQGRTVVMRPAPVTRTDSWTKGPPNNANANWSATAGYSRYTRPDNSWERQPQGKGKGKGGKGTSKGAGYQQSGNHNTSGFRSTAATVNTQSVSNINPRNPVPQAGRKCGICRDEGRQWEHDYTTCEYWWKNHDEKKKEGSTVARTIAVEGSKH